MEREESKMVLRFMALSENSGGEDSGGLAWWGSCWFCMSGLLLDIFVVMSREAEGVGLDLKWKCVGSCFG